MKRVSQIRVVLVLLTFLTGAMLYVLYGNTAKAADSLTAALPTVNELPLFSNVLQTPATAEQASLAAKRKTDSLFLMVWVFTKASKTEAQRLVDQAITTSQASHMPTGSPSGRLIGQEVWQSQRPGNVRGSYQLITRDGRSVVVIRAVVPIKGRNTRGQVVQPVIAPADLTLFENLAINCLSNLSKMGYTSGGPVVRESSTARRKRR